MPDTFFESLFHWVRQVGYAGTAVILDDRRLMVAKNPRDGRVFYPRAMAMDHYELLREVIDSADQLDGLFMAVLTGWISMTHIRVSEATPFTPRCSRG